jgi:DNA-binding CsgD family transcriptional regulator
MATPLQDAVTAKVPLFVFPPQASAPAAAPAGALRRELSDFSRLLLALYQAAQQVPVREFQDTVLGEVRPLLHFDAAVWGTATMTDTGIDLHSVHRLNFPDDMFNAFQQVRHQDSAAMRVTQQPRMTIGFAAEEEFAREDQADIRRFARDYGQHHCFITSDINPLTRFVQWISLFRSDPQRRCTDREVAVLSELGPHLMQALAINRLVHLEHLLGDASRESWSVGIADQRGVLYHADPRFRELVQAEWRLPGGRLPPELLEVLHGPEPRIAGRRVVLESALEQDLYFLKARERQPVDSLTAREFTVARLLASGMTHKQIALQLKRSPETVRSQAKAIFAKLAINNVALLAPLLVLRH